MTQTNELTRQHLPKKRDLICCLKGIAISGIFLYHLILPFFPGGFSVSSVLFFPIPDVYHFLHLYLGNKLSLPGTGLL